MLARGSATWTNKILIHSLFSDGKQQRGRPKYAPQGAAERSDSVVLPAEKPNARFRTSCSGLSRHGVVQNFIWLRIRTRSRIIRAPGRKLSVPDRA